MKMNNCIYHGHTHAHQLINALHTLMKFKSYIPLNKIVSQALHAGNFYDISGTAFGTASVVQVCLRCTCATCYCRC